LILPTNNDSAVAAKWDMLFHRYGIVMYTMQLSSLTPSGHLKLGSCGVDGRIWSSSLGSGAGMRLVISLVISFTPRAVKLAKTRVVQVCELTQFGEEGTVDVHGEARVRGGHVGWLWGVTGPS
jgi:hypothetical protein